MFIPSFCFEAVLSVRSCKRDDPLRKRFWTRVEIALDHLFSVGQEAVQCVLQFPWARIEIVCSLRG